MRNKQISEIHDTIKDERVIISEKLLPIVVRSFLKNNYNTSGININKSSFEYIKIIDIESYELLDKIKFYTESNNDNIYINQDHSLSQNFSIIRDKTIADENYLVTIKSKKKIKKHSSTESTTVGFENSNKIEAIIYQKDKTLKIYNKLIKLKKITGVRNANGRNILL